MAKTDPGGMLAMIEGWKRNSGGGAISVPTRKVRLDHLLQFSVNSTSVSRITSEFVRLGIHPFDEFGRKRFNRQPWWHAFSETAGEVTFSNALTPVLRGDLSQEIMKSQYELIEDVIFANSFFAIEETGLAYPSLSDDGGRRSRRAGRVAARLRERQPGPGRPVFRSERLQAVARRAGRARNPTRCAASPTMSSARNGRSASTTCSAADRRATSSAARSRSASSI